MESICKIKKIIAFKVMIIFLTILFSMPQFTCALTKVQIIDVIMNLFRDLSPYFEENNVEEKRESARKHILKHYSTQKAEFYKDYNKNELINVIYNNAINHKLRPENLTDEKLMSVINRAAERI
jgi:hypothetical protein